MYPVFKCHTMYPDGAALHASVLTLLPLKMIMGGTDKPPAETKVRSVVFEGFSPETVWGHFSPVTPITRCCGMSGIPVSSIFHMLNGL